MACPCCQNARDWPGTTAARTFSHGCLYCGARLIWSIQRLPIARSEASARCKAMLGYWVGDGFSEAEIRRLAKLPEAPLEPLAKVSDKGRRDLEKAIEKKRRGRK